MGLAEIAEYDVNDHKLALSAELGYFYFEKNFR